MTTSLPRCAALHSDAPLEVPQVGRRTPREVLGLHDEKAFVFLDNADDDIEESTLQFEPRNLICRNQEAIGRRWMTHAVLFVDPCQ